MGACVGRSEWFDGGRRGRKGRSVVARRGCWLECGVLVECSRYRVAAGEVWGVWGGADEGVLRDPVGSGLVARVVVRLGELEAAETEADESGLVG